MEIKKGRSIYNDTMNKIHKTDKGIECCGGLMKCVCHIDGAKFYINQYECECGNHISVETKRTKEYARWW